MTSLIWLLVVEDNPRLRPALSEGLEAMGGVRVVHSCDSGEAAVEYCLDQRVDAVLMDVQLAGQMNGIEAAVAIRRELPPAGGLLLDPSPQSTLDTI